MFFSALLEIKTLQLVFQLLLLHEWSILLSVMFKLHSSIALH
jgi:hypothetical protein